MTPSDFTRIVRDAEAKLAQARSLSREEQLILLAAMLLEKPTRQETRYGRG